MGITDDVTNLVSAGSQARSHHRSCWHQVECKFWGLGGDGTVGANKNSIKDHR